MLALGGVAEFGQDRLTCMGFDEEGVDDLGSFSSHITNIYIYTHQILYIVYHES